MMSVLRDPRLEKVLASLHSRSDGQLPELDAYYADRSDADAASEPAGAQQEKAFLGDKLVALDRDKAEFCYQLCRAKNARRVVEIGTSYGVSTLYLAAAIRDNLRATAGQGVVIGTEYEPAKARAARANFAAAGLGEFIELREGDLRETLKVLAGPIDLVLVDIWIPMARPGLELVAPHLAPGAIVLCDYTTEHRDEYADYFAFLNDPANGFRTMTLPFNGGLELSVRC